MKSSLCFALALGCGTTSPAANDAGADATADGSADAGVEASTADVAQEAATDAAVPTDTLGCATAQTVWPTAGGCFTRRYSTTLVGPTTTPTLAWQAAFGPDTEITASTSTVFVAGESVNVEADDLSTGAFSWDSSTSLGFTVGGVATLSGSTASVWVAQTGEVQVFAQSTGVFASASATGTGAAETDYSGSVAFASDGTFYVGGKGTTAFTSAGVFAWNVDGSLSVEDAMIAPFSDGESVVVRQTGVSAPDLIAYRLSGAHRFAYPIALDFDHTESVFACDHVVAANRNGNTRVIDAIDGAGKRSWRATPFPTAVGIPHVTFAFDGARIHVGAVDGNDNYELAILDCDGNLLRHQFGFGGPVTVDGAGDVFGVCTGNHPCAIDATGAPLWTLASLTMVAQAQVRFAILPSSRIALPFPGTTNGLQVYGD